MTTTIDHDVKTRQAFGAMDTTSPDPEVPERSSGRRRFSAKYKAKVLAEYDTLERSARVPMLPLELLSSSLITSWRQQRDTGAEAALARTGDRSSVWYSARTLA